MNAVFPFDAEALKKNDDDNKSLKSGKSGKMKKKATIQKKKGGDESPSPGVKKKRT